MKTVFLTGSRVYGTPRPDSDIDIVVLMDKNDAVELANNAPPCTVEAYDNGSLTMKFGKLNLIAVSSRPRFEAWRKGTEELIERAPVSRAYAVEHFKSLFAVEEKLFEKDEAEETES